MRLIDKDALVEELESLLDKGKYHEEYDCAYRDGNNDALYALKGKLDTLEVKEVDLGKYYRDFLQKEWFGKKCNRTMSEMMAFTAKHFFELGLKAQKGEET